jgi:alpha-1,6-mannosyltransferase
MHICDVDNFYSPRGGGVKTYHDQKLSFFLEDERHEYTLVYAGAEESRRDVSPRVRVISLPGVAMGDNYHFVLDAVRLRKELRLLRPDVVELGEPYLLPWVARAASIGRQWPLVGFWHADFPRTYVQRPIGRVNPLLGQLCGEVAWWYARRTYGSLDAVFASSATVAETLRSRGLSPVYETPLAVDTQLFNPAKRDLGLRRSLGIEDNTTLVIFPHRLAEEKGLSAALAAFAVVEGACEVALVLAGAGPGEALVKEYAATHPRVRYLGYISDPQLMATWYASSDVVLSLCAYETFGLSTLEAAASGCAVVGSDAGAVGEFIRRSGGGAHVPTDDPKAIGKAVAELLGDASRLRDCRERGLAYVEREFNWRRTFSRMLECYDRVLAAE